MVAGVAVPTTPPRPRVPTVTARIARVPRDTIRRTMHPLLVPPGIGAEPGAPPVAWTAPPPGALVVWAEAYRASMQAVGEAGKPAVAWSLAGAVEAYSRGATPGSLWPRDVGTTIAQALLRLATLAWLARQIELGAWVLWTNGDDLSATRADIAAAGGLGWVPDSYITGDPHRRATWLDRLGIATGMISAVTPIAGVEATAAAITEAGAASSGEAANAAAASLPAAVAQGGPGAALAVRGMGAGWTQILSTISKTAPAIVKWGALMAIGIAGVHELPNVINTNRQAVAAATNAGVNAAGAMIDKGIQTNNPALVQSGMEWLSTFQKGAAGDDWIKYGALGVLGGMFLAKR